MSSSRILCGLALVFVLFASVNAHGWMSSPTPRGQYLTPPKPEYMEYGPASRDPNDPMFACRNDTVAPRANWIPLKAGESQSITLQFNAKHVGDCFVYLSYDGDKPTEQMKWFKIWEQHACKDSNNYNIPIPSYLPSGSHVVFRWEWYALHVYPIVEYYAQCVDATLSGSATGALPQPQVNIPGHMPVFSGDYALRTNNYWWPWDNQTMFFTGPALATLNGQQSRPTTSATPVTSAPVTSAPVTSAPATVAPVTQAPATSAPTVKATAPPAAPTTKATAPPVAPTTKATQAPVSPLLSVKLSVLPGAGFWWFASTVAGHRSSEIAKMELKDNGNIKDFSPMVNSWNDASLGPVWVFDPSTRGPLTLPLTIRASLSSGSSITFVVNGMSSTVVDSGATFP